MPLPWYFAEFMILCPALSDDESMNAASWKKRKQPSLKLSKIGITYLHDHFSCEGEQRTTIEMGLSGPTFSLNWSYE